MADRHRAPRRRILVVRKAGGYGDTFWNASLECGHVERRKRSPKSEYVGCSTCLNEERLLVDVLLMPDEKPTVNSDPDNDAIVAAARATANIASVLKVSSEMVDVRIVAGERGLELDGASVWVPKEVVDFWSRS